MSKFGVKYGPDTAFLAYITGWFLLLVTLLAIVAFARVSKRRAGYAGLCYLLGLWWIGIGVGIYVTFGRFDNLLLDSLKGLLVVVLTWRCQAGGLVVRR
jgi:Na+/pantothenate symporter